VSEVIAADEAAVRLTRAVRIRMRGGEGASNGAADRYNNVLMNLRELLRQASSRGASTTAADVMIDVHDAGHIVRLRVNVVRVNVTADLPQRVATVVREPDCCDLIGPVKVAVDRLRHSDDVPDVEPGLAMAAAHDETCASIERY